ncbi:MAG TPA: hypothetical protein VKU19_12500 [Bryobacteraceae bacterium]|nr:hypothetical protein [Bryobacteraceae bacterium]
MTLIVLAGFTFLYMGLGLCRSCDYSPRHRPNSVPANAVWAGGPDGGSYFFCGVDMERGVNPCTVWNDETGSVIVSGDFWISGQDRAATADELRFGWYDGSVIGLQIVTPEKRYLTLQSVKAIRPFTVCEVVANLAVFSGKEIAVLGRLDKRDREQELVQGGCGEKSATGRVALVDSLKDAPITPSGFLRLNEKTLHEKFPVVKASTPLRADSTPKHEPRFWAAVYGRLELGSDREPHLIFAGNMINYYGQNHEPL